MTVFQWITLSVLGLLLARDGLALFLRRPRFRQDRLFRWLVCAAAFITIYNPALTSELAVLLGINRGTDLVLYIFVLTFIATSFYFYSQTVRLQRQLTEIVRHIAITEARNGSRTLPSSDVP